MKASTLFTWTAAALGAALFAGCVGAPDVTYRPAAQILPQHIKSIAVRPFTNSTQQFGLEDRLTLVTQTAFLDDGDFHLVPEDQADGVLIGDISRYILTTLATDANLVPTSYKLTIIVNLKFLDRTTNTYLWNEPNYATSQVFAASTLPGGMTELQAQEAIWDVMSRKMVERVVQGFGTVTGASLRKYAPTASTEAAQTPLPEVPAPASTATQSPTPGSTATTP